MSKTSKRNLFEELMEGVDAMQQHREGKVTLRTHKVQGQSRNPRRERSILSPCGKSSTPHVRLGPTCCG
jgi:hypothetical protein